MPTAHRAWGSAPHFALCNSLFWQEALRGRRCDRRLIAESLQRPIEEVRLDASLDDSGLALDSLSLVTLNVALEERYDITLPDFISEDARTVRSVRAVAELIASHIAENTKEGAPV